MFLVYKIAMNISPHVIKKMFNLEKGIAIKDALPLMPLKIFPL